ncbi:MAG: hypothetical protein AUK47_25385 [Deltaproteobacteria bacterium CG2_30_63_29]|nr:MAG: hypothetical protein AUK47_25385 [Deltaproteobacteria bacterium CG2_30_63_29]PIW00195.1 MAG: hypothetical protein COW42_08570 [Deltaproteobacteria bacterium CG17_big_fil_post_rev_8_21_14_2_50_63_7]
MNRVSFASLIVMAIMGTSLSCVGQTSLPIPEDLPKKEVLVDPLTEQKGWLGVSLQLTTKEEAKALGYAQPLISVDIVFAGSPAESSGFQAGDLIVKFNETPVYEVADLIDLVMATKPGSKVTFLRIRDEKEEVVPLLLGVRPDAYDLLRDHFVGKEAPDLIAKVVATETEAVLPKKGVVLFEFWATWCGPCRASMPHLTELHEKYPELTVIGLSDEESADIAAFLKENPLPYLIIRDLERGTSRAYMVNALPTLFLIDDGVIRHIFIGSGEFDELDKALTALLEAK